MNKKYKWYFLVNKYCLCRIESKMFKNMMLKHFDFHIRQLLYSEPTSTFVAPLQLLQSSSATSLLAHNMR